MVESHCYQSQCVQTPNPIQALNPICPNFHNPSQTQSNPKTLLDPETHPLFNPKPSPKPKTPISRTTPNLTEHIFPSHKKKKKERQDRQKKKKWKKRDRERRRETSRKRTWHLPNPPSQSSPEAIDQTSPPPVSASSSTIMKQCREGRIANGLNSKPKDLGIGIHRIKLVLVSHHRHTNKRKLNRKLY